VQCYRYIRYWGLGGGFYRPLQGVVLKVNWGSGKELGVEPPPNPSAILTLMMMINRGQSLFE